jgi:hypothetical protein
MLHKKLTPKSNAINLMTNYFLKRKKLVKLGNFKSYLLQISPAVLSPEGSILGPLLFQIFFNEIIFFIKLLADLIADDTTLYNNYDPKNFSIQLAIEDFKKSCSNFQTFKFYCPLFREPFL